MTRLLSGALASAMALAFLFAGPAYATGSTHTMHSSMMTHHHMKHSCPAGQHWIKGYKRNGKYVHGYCRK